jgi:hypothetical protein
MATTQKPRKRTGKTASARTRAGPAQARLQPPVSTLQEELLVMARDGAQSLQRAIMTLAVVAILIGAAAGIWSLRPVPSYSSEGVTQGSPFDVTFRMENTHPWLALDDLRVSCVLAQIRASGIPPTLIEASDVRFPRGDIHRLEPGETVIFKCPFRDVMEYPINDDPEVAQKAEIYFRSDYDLPLLGSLRISEDSPPFVLNTRLLPPRWTRKPEE